MGALAFIRRQTIRKPLFGRGGYTQTPEKQTLEDLSGYCRVLLVVDGGLTQTLVESFRWGSLSFYLVWRTRWLIAVEATLAVVEATGAEVDEA